MVITAISRSNAFPKRYVLRKMEKKTIWKKKTRICECCGKEFIANSPPHRYCHNPCLSPKTYFRVVKYKHIIGVRSAFLKCKERNPELARHLKEKMREEEGEEFTEMALDGL